MLSQAPADSPPVEWRTNTAIAVGMAMPIAALAVLSWLEPAVGARLASSSTTTAAAAAAPVPVAGTGRVQKPKQSRVEVVATYPHDKSASTEGLHYEGGVLYESIGGDGQSSLRRVDLKTGRVLQSVPLATGMVGEGLARTPSGLVQLTWRHQTGFVYDPRTLAVLRSFTYPGEGKGLCYDGTSLVMSDGSDALTFRRPDTFEVQRTLRIVKDGVPMPKISELECVNGAVSMS